MAGLIKVGEAAAIASVVGAPGRFHLGLRDAANMVGQRLVRVTQQGMRDGPQSGRLYRNLKRQSSAPGQYPAIQSGQLVGTLGYTVNGSSSLAFGSTGAFNSGFDYALGLHEGTSKMAPRPYLTLTVTRERGYVQRTLGDVPFRKIVGGA